MHHGRADIVDQLLLDQLLGVPDRIEDLAHRQRRGGVLADQPEGRLVLGGRRVLQPEQAIGLQVLAEPPGLDRREAVVDVVQQMDVPAQRVARLLEQLGHEAHVLRRAPLRFLGQRSLGRLVIEALARHAIGRRHARHAGLEAHGAIALLQIFLRALDRLRDIATIGMAIDHASFAGGAAQQLVDGHARQLALDVPQGHVDRRDRGHRHRAAPPIGALVEILPDVFDAMGISADKARNHMVREVARHCQFAPVQRRIAKAVDALVGLDLQRDEVAAGARHDDAGGSDTWQNETPWKWSGQYPLV